MAGETGRRLIKGFNLLGLFVYSVLGVLFGFLALVVLAGPWAIVGAALLLGSLAVGIGAVSRSEPHRAGALIMVGAVVSSGTFGVFVALWTTSAWGDLLTVAATSIIFLGGGPTLIGFSYWRHRPGRG